jgi:hypothetical protein
VKSGAPDSRRREWGIEIKCAEDLSTNETVDEMLALPWGGLALA